MRGRCTEMGHGMWNFWAFFLFHNEIKDKILRSVHRTNKLDWAESENFRWIISGQPELPQNTAASPPEVKRIRTLHVAHIWTDKSCDKNTAVSPPEVKRIRTLHMAHIWTTRTRLKHCLVSTRSRVNQKVLISHIWTARATLKHTHSHIFTRSRANQNMYYGSHLESRINTKTQMHLHQESGQSKIAYGSHLDKKYFAKTQSHFHQKSGESKSFNMSHIWTARATPKHSHVFTRSQANQNVFYGSHLYSMSRSIPKHSCISTGSGVNQVYRIELWPRCGERTKNQ